MVQGGRGDTRLLRFLAEQAALGVVLGSCATWLIVRLDAFGLATLAEAAPNGWLAIGLLFVGLALTFASLAMGTGIFLLPRDEERWR